MQSYDVNFSSLNADRLIDGTSYKVSRANYDAYLFFRTEYRHVTPLDYERAVVVTSRKKFDLKKMLSDLKEKILSTDGFLSVSPNSSIYSFLTTEYRENSFTKDYNNNYIVPSKELYKTKTRK